jgi:pyrroloquinoline quinone biosynthesis protein D
MIAPDMRPRLAPKVRLRHDAQSGRYMLLYPEKGMQLNGTAADIVQLCTGERTIAEIIRELANKYSPKPSELIAAEVTQFLEALEARLLMRFEP